MKLTTWLFVALCVGGGPGVAFAQTPAEGRLLVTVVDPSNGVISGATVKVTAQDAAKPVPIAPATTTPAGLAVIEHLALGRYTIQAEFPGFDPAVLKDVRVRAGDNKHVLVLPLRKLEDAVTVVRDAQTAASDPRGGSFSTSLTKEEIAALSDDPAEMAQQLIDMAGGNAVIKIDSFVGGTLPPKALIKSIHLVRDTFPAENHSAESDEINIITQPGVGPLHGGGNTRYRDGSMSGRSPFTPVKGPERTENVEANIGGALATNKSSFSIQGGSHRSFDTPILNVNLPTGTVAQTLNVRRPNDSWSTFGLLDYAPSVNHVLRFSYDQSDGTGKNQGIGAFDLLERAYSADSQDHELRIQESGPISRRLYGNTRLQVQWTNSASHSAVEQPTIRVIDAFTSGGAQRAGSRHIKDFEFGSDIDYVRGAHAVRTGLLLDGRHFRADDSANYLGTYVFTSLAAFNAGQPASYTRRIGDPLITYVTLQAGAYIQDDIRLRKDLVISPGLRYEAQTHVHDGDGIGPRVGMTWAPAKSGHTTVRASYGIFYNWLGAGTYEQTLRIDGIRQREVQVVKPSYPDPGVAGEISATNKYLLSPDLQMVRVRRLSAGIDQVLTPKVRVNATYELVRFAGQLRGLNLNPPVNGVRPDVTFANVIQAVSDASQHNQQLRTELILNLAGGVRTANRARWNLQRTTIRFQYRLAKSYNNTDGPFNPPPTGTLDTEWGPSSGDRRHRFMASVNSHALKNLNANISVNAQSGSPYTITTGVDNNGDSIFNDRPAGVGRNTVRTPWQTTISANLAYALVFGERRISFFAQIQNLTNRPNYVGYSGDMTSFFFLQPTAVANPRKIDLGMTFSF